MKRQFLKNSFISDEAGSQQEAGFVRRMLRLRRGHRVLDAPCGTDRIAAHLAKAACSVTGVDRNKRFIDRAGARFHKERLTGTFEVNDLRQIEFSATFHGVFSWFASFGYFSDSENVDLMRRYARALKRGGRLLIDQPNREHRGRNEVGVDHEGKDMSRSRKKNPISGITTSDSEKEDKRIANRRERRINTRLLDSTHDDTKLAQKREVSDVWSMDKDGKYRFDPQKHSKLLRK